MKAFTCLVLLSFVAPSFADEAATKVFAKLKALEGTWTGSVGKPGGEPTKIVYKVTAGGSVVMETLFPGSDHEMISMYHLEKDELIATHYCAMGNQPRMKLIKSTDSEFTFDFIGGNGVDPEKTVHIHGGKILLKPDGTMEAAWKVFKGSKEVAENLFFLKREKA